MTTFFRKAASDIFLVMFALVFMLGSCGCRFPYRGNGKGYALLAVITIGILFLCGGQFIRKFADSIGEKQLDRFYICAAAVMLVIQLALVIGLKVTPSNDAKYVDIAARNFAADGDFENIYRGLSNKADYFSRYPNNWAILLFLSCVHRAVYLLTGRCFNIIPQLLAVACVQLAFLFAYISAKKLLDSRKNVALMTLFMLFSPQIYAYSQIFYTDSFVMPFVTGSICAFVCGVKSDKTRKKVLLLLLTALLLALAYEIKASAVIVAIAVMIYSMLVQKPKWTAMLAVFCAAAAVGINSALYSGVMSLGISDELSLYENRFPAVSWITMASVGDGSFDSEHFKAVNSVKGLDNKKRFLNDRLKNIINGYRQEPRSFIDHITVKTIQTWGDPTSMSQHYMKKAANQHWYSAIYCSGISYFIRTGIQGCWLIFLLCSCIKGFSDGGSGGMFFFRMAAAGLVCFLFIWESKPRYIVQFLPIYYLMAADGVDFILDKLSGIKFVNKILSTNHKSGILQNV